MKRLRRRVRETRLNQMVKERQEHIKLLLEMSLKPQPKHGKTNLEKRAHLKLFSRVAGEGLNLGPLPELCLQAES